MKTGLTIHNLPGQINMHCLNITKNELTLIKSMSRTTRLFHLAQRALESVSSVGGLFQPGGTNQVRF